MLSPSVVYPGEGLMDRIQDISELYRGDVIHHPALGFAVVDRVSASAARLSWEFEGSRLRRWSAPSC